MILYFVLGSLAAMGLFSALWALLGWLLPGAHGGTVVCMCRPGGKGSGVLRRYRWLRDLGLVRWPLVGVDCGLTDEERQQLEGYCPGIEICSLEELKARLELEREQIG